MRLGGVMMEEEEEEEEKKMSSRPQASRMCRDEEEGAGVLY